MRPDHQKLDATHEEGAKDQAGDLENRHQPRAASKQGHEREKSGRGHALRRDGDSDSDRKGSRD